MAMATVGRRMPTAAKAQPSAKAVGYRAIAMRGCDWRALSGKCALDAEEGDV